MATTHNKLGGIALLVGVWCFAPAVLTTSTRVLVSDVSGDHSDAGVDLDGELSVVDGVEFVWQAPPAAKGVLAVLHGCSHRGTDAFPKSATCAECIGLPIETRVVAAALARGWAVAAVTSEDRRSGCWGRGDAPRVAAAVAHVRAKSGAGAATATLGASSGGSMATAIPGVVGAVAQIMPSHGPLDGTHPPVRFVHMARDERRAAAIARQLHQLRAAGVDAAELVVHPEPLSAEALHRRGPGPGGLVLPTEELAAKVFAALRRGGELDAAGVLTRDPRASRWRDAVRPVVPASVDSLVPDASPLSEVLNAAWAYHEFTDAFLDESLDWLDEKATNHALHLRA